ncbi:hypothetical protein B0H63DRAFT_557148 [Podospora didyma]|uniref:2EXR domain-containing protein n=1 Tax=Podospora didyma TaxID=330526 RepID=A0AAE0NYK7_9PEZI|nr:hypothetical protein B0H63DRAFT_557148 [Podospora didyma]
MSSPLVDHQIFNEIYFTAPSIPSPPTFSLFPRFPAELRLKIWRDFLKRSPTRMIGLTIYHSPNPTYSPDNWDTTLTNRLGNAISGSDYRLVRTSKHEPNPLLQVCREARDVFLTYNRVGLPYHLHARGEDDCLYFNPDKDFLRLQLHEDAPVRLFADVLHDCLAWDRKGRGIANLVVDRDLASRGSELEPVQLSPLARASLHSILLNLSQFYVQHEASHDPRLVVGEINDRIRYNRAYPLQSTVECFEMVGPDPRSIDEGLELVSIGDDPCGTMTMWLQLEQNLGLVRPPGSELNAKIMITTIDPFFRADLKEINTCARAREYLEEEEALWRSLFVEPGVFWRIPNPDGPDGPQDPPPQAIGFWLVDLDVFGEAPRAEPYNPRRWNFKLDVDLRQRRPLLGLFHVS